MARSGQIKPSGKPGPAAKMFKFKEGKVVGECDVLGCKRKAHRATAFRCAPHKKEIRTAQLAANNRVWRARVSKGVAGHHTVYTIDGVRQATRWAGQNPDRAEALIKADASVVDLETFKELLAKAPKSKPTKKAKTKTKAKTVKKKAKKKSAKPKGKKAAKVPSPDPKPTTPENGAVKSKLQVLNEKLTQAVGDLMPI